MSEMAEVKALFHRLTGAWTGGDFDLLERHYHPDIVGLEPDPPRRVAGRQQVLAEYRTFLDAGGRIDSLRSRDVQVRPFGNAALLTYFFETGRTLADGSKWEFSGKETLLFVRNDDTWQLAHWHFSIDK